MIRTKEVRERAGVDAYQIWRYRQAGLFPYDPISVSYGGLGSERVYPDESVVHLEVLEELRKLGFTLGQMLVLFLTMKVGEGMQNFISFDDKARLKITPEGLVEAKRIIELIVTSYPQSYDLSPRGRRPFGKG